MEQTRTQSAYYPAWVEQAPKLHAAAERAVLERDFHTLGTLMEQSTLMMHASMLAVTPAILFLTEATLSVMHKVYALRKAGLPAYFTIDAGPHVKVLVPAEHANAVHQELEKLASVVQLVSCSPGPGTQLTDPPSP
jgi:diphosphomevalonate decarboxylase